MNLFTLKMNYDIFKNIHFQTEKYLKKSIYIKMNYDIFYIHFQEKGIYILKQVKKSII